MRSDSNNLDGKVETRYRAENDQTNQEIEVEVENAAPGTVYSIRVFFGDQEVDFGTMTANGEGEAEREFELEDGAGDLADLLPAGLTVRDMTRVRILEDGNTVLEGDL